MIPPSGLYRIPRADPIRNEDAVRFARLEYGGPETAWIVSGTPAVPAPRPGFLGWISSWVRRRSERRAALPNATPRPLSSNLAAVHLAGDETRLRPSERPSHTHAFRTNVEPGALVLPVLEPRPAEELCECEP